MIDPRVTTLLASPPDIDELRQLFGFLLPMDAPNPRAETPEEERAAILQIVQDHWNTAMSADDDISADVCASIASEIRARGEM